MEWISPLRNRGRSTPGSGGSGSGGPGAGSQRRGPRGAECAGWPRTLVGTGGARRHGARSSSNSGVVGGAAAGWSALAGAGAYFIPNALFALRLAVSVRAGKASPFTFLSGELIKLFATALLLWLLSRVAQDSIVWPAALLGLILTLKGYLLLLMFRKLS